MISLLALGGYTRSKNRGVTAQQTMELIHNRTELMVSLARVNKLLEILVVEGMMVVL